MADQPGGPVTGSRPVETTPIRVGRPQPGTAQLQPNRMYPATVLEGGNQPVLRLLGHNVNAEPRYPGLHAGQRLAHRAGLVALGAGVRDHRTRLG